MIPAARPYPGELASSALVRCCRQFQVPMKRLGQTIFSRSWKPNFLLPMPLGPIAVLLQTDPIELLRHHTAFPFCSAYLSSEACSTVMATALSANKSNSHLGAVLQNASAGAAFRRYCPTCAAEELERHGESYWHVEQNLPGVWCCVRHREFLVETTIRTKHAYKTTYALPHECDGRRLGDGRVPSVMLGVARRVRDVQGRNLSEQLPSSPSHYRGLLEQMGLLLHGRMVHVDALMRGIRRRFSAEFFRDAGLGSEQFTWAALMVRPGCSEPHCPIKHVLLCDALAHAARPARKTCLTFRSSGPPKTAARDVDAFYSRQAAEVLRLATKEGSVLTTEQFLRAASCYGTYRHRGFELPKLRAVVLRFRGSGSSVKPLARGRILFRNRPDERV